MTPSPIRRAALLLAAVLPMTLTTSVPALASELAPVELRASGGKVVGRYSATTIVLALEVSRTETRIVASAVKARPFERVVDPFSAPAPVGRDEAVVSLLLHDESGRGYPVREVVKGLCLDHVPETPAHIEGDRIRLHREIIHVELPDVAGFRLLDVAVATSGDAVAAIPRSLGTLRIPAPTIPGQARGGESTLGNVIWPEDNGDPDIYTVAGNAAEVSSRINVVVVPDGYTYAEKATMQSHFNTMVAAFRARTPSAEHDPFINYILVYAYSSASGTDQCDCSIVVNTAMNTHFPNETPSCGHSDNRCLYYGGGSGLCDADTSTANISAAELRAPADDQTIIMVNTSRYGGCGGYRAVYAAGNSSATEIAIHELGHSLGNLDDEYSYTNSCGTYAGEINTSMSSTTGAWPEWIAELGAPVQGAQYYQQCIYRPRANCEMRALGQAFCEVCNQQYALTYFGNARVNTTAPIKAKSPASPLNANVGLATSFSVTPRLAVGATVTNAYVWRIQGPGYPTPTVLPAAGPTLSQTFTAAGAYTLSAELTADTNFVKPSRTGANRDTVTWSVNAIACPSIAVSPPSPLADTWAGAAYSVSFTQTGGTAPLVWNSTGTLPPGTALGAATGVLGGTSTTIGTFDFAVTVTDTNGCAASKPYSQKVVPTFAAAGLLVDPASVVGTASNANAVLEPGETVVVAPRWRNLGPTWALRSGTLSDFTGPAGMSYAIVDGSADWGSVAPGATADPFNATSNAYLLAVGSPASRPATHWDTTVTETGSHGDSRPWTLHVGASFGDVATGYLFYQQVETLLHAGVTAGCTATTFCPSGTVSRAQMAMFLARAMAGSDAAVPVSGVVGSTPYSCATGGSSLFSDVLPTDQYCRHTHYIAAANVTQGCTAGTFCPTGQVSRAQMAMFLARAMAGGDGAVPLTYSDSGTGRSYSCDPASPASHFADVTAANGYCRHSNYLWSRSVADGCTATTYCPATAVSRGQMAKLLTNAFGLRLYRE